MGKLELQSFISINTAASLAPNLLVAWQDAYGESISCWLAHTIIKFHYNMYNDHFYTFIYDAIMQF